MCGIAGLLRLGEKPVSKDEVQSMCDAMVHRGPNDAGYYAASEVVLGMRRLSIIDLETGHQPVHNEDQSVWVVFNGEIYNFKHLRADLELQGHRFYTDTDTEVTSNMAKHASKKCAACSHLPSGMPTGRNCCWPAIDSGSSLCSIQ